jgi:hypothetical protein
MTDTAHPDDPTPTAELIQRWLDAHDAEVEANRRREDAYRQHTEAANRRCAAERTLYDRLQGGPPHRAIPHDGLAIFAEDGRVRWLRLAPAE